MRRVVVTGLGLVTPFSANRGQKANGFPTEAHVTLVEKPFEI